MTNPLTANIATSRAVKFSLFCASASTFGSIDDWAHSTPTETARQQKCKLSSLYVSGSVADEKRWVYH